MSDTDKNDRPIGRLAVFGAYNDSDLYQRNRILVEQFEALSETAQRIRPATAAAHTLAPGQSLWRRLRRAFGDALALLRQRRRLADAEVVFVPYPAYLDLLLLWLLPRRARRLLVADAFLELQSTVVEDRGLLAAGSLGERTLLAFQRFTLSRADLVLIDTPAQADLLANYLRGTATRILSVPVGIDETQWQPLPAAPPGARLRVLFFGTFIPLHGVQYIVAAARWLARAGEAIDLHIVGDGQVARELAADLAREPLANLVWERRLLPTVELRGRIAEADLVLGIFGASPKAGAVAPYKLHQALASNRPVLTRSGPGVDAMADPQRGLHTCAPADPVALARGILSIRDGLLDGDRVATREIYDEFLSQRVIRRALRQACVQP